MACQLLLILKEEIFNRDHEINKHWQSSLFIIYPVGFEMKKAQFVPILLATLLAGNASATVNWDWRLTSSSGTQVYGQAEIVTINATFENLVSSTGNLTIPNATLFYTTSQGGIYNGVDGDGTAGQTAILYSYLAALSLSPGQSSSITLASLIPLLPIPINSYTFDASIEGTNIPRTAANTFNWSVSANPPPIPEPTTLVLMSIGLAAITLAKKKEKSKAIRVKPRSLSHV